MADKGHYSETNLPVAQRYVYPGSRHAALLAGGVGVLLIGAVVAFNVYFQDSALLSNGPLSSNHAAFADDCATCHTAFGDVSAAQCNVCHEKYGDEIGAHSFTTHYLYRTGDFTRVVPSPNEVDCTGCHTEHVGRDVVITNVPDDACLTCHAYGSFNDDHPEFHFAAENVPDPANLKFPHTKHVLELRKEDSLATVEQTCLYCHHPDDEGRGFQPLSFDEQCAPCHLTSITATPLLPAGDPSDTDDPGVLTLSAIQRSEAPGTRWSYFVNPNEFVERGGRLRKQPLYHKDQWVLENLRRLRTAMYRSHELANLLDASSDVAPRETQKLYNEALTTLRTYAEELRAQPNQQVQQELDDIETLLDEVQRRLRDPYSPLNEMRFAVTSATLDTTLTDEQVATYQQLVDDLTQACQECHRVEQATILRAQADQSTLYRAEFDHRAHIIQARCQDCHSTIPIREAFATRMPADSTADYAAIQNLPTIATCQQCHQDGKAANTCVTCHLFHPDKSQHSNLLLYVE